MGLKDELEEKVFIRVLRALFGEAVEHALEGGIWAFLLKFYFGLTIKTAVMTAIIIVVLSVLKKMYYREDLYLAFAILLVFQESFILAWLLFIYISYFKGIKGLYDDERRAKSDKFSVLKSRALGFAGQYIAPFIIIFMGRKFRDIRNNIMVLVFMAFIYHLYYFVFLLIDMAMNKKKYTKEKATSVILYQLRESKLNMAVTIILILLFKGIVFKMAYTDFSWGFLDRLFEAVGWVI